jgi:hypothetical protein
MSKGSPAQTTSSTDLPDWIKPYAQNYLQQASGLASKPYQAYGGQLVAGMDPRTTAGLDQQAQLGANGTAAGNAGQSNLQDVLSGKYLNPNSNPALQGQIDSAQQDVVRNYNMAVKPQTESAMVGSGSFGNSGLQQVQQQNQYDLQKNLGNISTQLRGNAYNTERANQQQALGLAPQYANLAYQGAGAQINAGQTAQQQQQTGLDSQYQQYLQQQGYAGNQLNYLGNALGTLKGGGTTTQTQNPGQAGTLQRLAGGALSGFAATGNPWGAAAGAGLGLLSDKRAKKDISKVGKMDDGTPIYTYKYKSGGPFHMGVMAQEAQKTNPQAVSKRPDGLLQVDYSKMGA